MLGDVRFQAFARSFTQLYGGFGVALEQLQTREHHLGCTVAIISRPLQLQFGSDKSPSSAYNIPSR